MKQQGPREGAMAASPASPLPGTVSASPPAIIGPPESIEPSAIYKLYRGTIGEIHGQQHRVWAEFPALQLCWAGFNLPATAYDRVSLLDLAGCECETFNRGSAEFVRVELYQKAGGDVPAQSSAAHAEPPRAESSAGLAHAAAGRLPVVTLVGSRDAALQEFVEALQQLLNSRESEGEQGLKFIQRRLFQYLWRNQGIRRTERALYEAQAVLAFNMDPKDGVVYLRGKLGKSTDDEVGEWLARMSAQTGGLDPTMLGGYFSRRDTHQVFKAFVSCLDFHGKDIVAALRQLFDTFKPGGEGQVITRILELWSEAYFSHWQGQGAAVVPKTAYKDADSVFQVAVSLIMLNTDLHIARKKTSVKRPPMSLHEYIENVRRLVVSEEVPDEALTVWYEKVKETEISLEPLIHRASFSELPVQPDIEGWLIAVIEPRMMRRYWAVLALQRMYLFSDASEVEPSDAIDLRDARVLSVVDDAASRERMVADLRAPRGLWPCPCLAPSATLPKSACRGGCKEPMLDIEDRAFEVCQPATSEPAILERTSGVLHIKPRARLVLVAESPELMEKWVSLISSGPF